MKHMFHVPQTLKRIFATFNFSTKRLVVLLLLVLLQWQQQKLD